MRGAAYASILSLIMVAKQCIRMQISCLPAGAERLTCCTTGGLNCLRACASNGAVCRALRGVAYAQICQPRRAFTALASRHACWPQPDISTTGIPTCPKPQQPRRTFRPLAGDFCGASMPAACNAVTRRRLRHKPGALRCTVRRAEPALCAAVCAASVTPAPAGPANAKAPHAAADRPHACGNAFVRVAPVPPG